MQRSTVAMICCCCAILIGAGCAEMRSTLGLNKSKAMQPQEMTRPSPPVQLKQLEPFIGTWEGTAEMVPDPKSPAATQPVETFTGGGTSEWALDGMAMRSTGWHEMPNDQKQTYTEYVMWDADARKFRSYYVSDWGEHGTGWMWTDPDGQTFHWTAKGVDAHGHTSTLSGTSTIVDRSTMKWTMTMKGPSGRMQMKGTSKRVK